MGQSDALAIGTSPVPGGKQERRPRPLIVVVDSKSPTWRNRRRLPGADVKTVSCDSLMAFWSSRFP